MRCEGYRPRAPAQTEDVSRLGRSPTLPSPLEGSEGPEREPLRRPSAFRDSDRDSFAASLCGSANHSHQLGAATSTSAGSVRGAAPHTWFSPSEPLPRREGAGVGRPTPPPQRPEPRGAPARLPRAPRCTTRARTLARKSSNDARCGRSLIPSRPQRKGHVVHKFPRKCGCKPLSAGARARSIATPGRAPLAPETPASLPKRVRNRHP